MGILRDFQSWRWQSVFSLFLLVPGAFAQRQQKIQMKDYSLCLPAGWSVERNDREDRVDTCNRDDSHKCVPSQDNRPYPGVVAMNILPSDRGYGIYQSQQDLIRKARITGEPLPTISDVELGRSNSGSAYKCWLARTLLYGDLWEDIYELSVDGRRFRVWVNYRNEPTEIESLRTAIGQILSSVAVGR